MSRGAVIVDGSDGEIRLETRTPRWSRSRPGVDMFPCGLASKRPGCFFDAGIDCEFPAADNRRGPGDRECCLGTEPTGGGVAGLFARCPRDLRQSGVRVRVCELVRHLRG